MNYWQLIETAPKDRPICVWLGDAGIDDLGFYCVPGSRFSAGWQWNEAQQKFKPCGLELLPVFVKPTHWMEIPDEPSAKS